MRSARRAVMGLPELRTFRGSNQCCSVCEPRFRDYPTLEHNATAATLTTSGRQLMRTEAGWFQVQYPCALLLQAWAISNTPHSLHNSKDLLALAHT